MARKGRSSHQPGDIYRIIEDLKVGGEIEYVVNVMGRDTRHGFVWGRMSDRFEAGISWDVEHVTVKTPNGGRDNILALHGGRMFIVGVATPGELQELDFLKVTGHREV